MSNDVLDDFLTESHEHLDQMEQGLLALETAREQGAEAISDMLNRLFRSVHSIKGAAGFLEFQKIVQLAHCMENIFGNLRERKEVPEASCVDVLLSAGDNLRELLNSIDDMEGIDCDTSIDALSVWCTDTPVASAPAGAAEVKTNSCFHYYKLEFPRGMWNELEQSLSGAAEIQKSEETVAYVSSVLEPDLLTVVTGEQVKIAVMDADEFSAVLDGSYAVAALEENTPQKTAETMPPVKSAQGNLVKDPQNPPRRNNGNGDGAPAASGNSTVRIDLGLLEQLMSLAGELVLVRNRHNRWYSHQQIQDETGREITQRLDTVTREIQTAVMKTRMQPLERVFSKLPRLVREVSRQLGKEITLEIAGADIEVDRAILESLGDPLTHLLRNSCDHGIESPAERKATGKNIEGMVKVSASHENGYILIDVADNGKGMDPEVIAAKAVEKGLISEQEVAALDSRRKLELVMLPGFSTAAALSNISGRGVGMDVVKSSVEKLGGTIEIDSRKGYGSKFTLRLPLTLAIIQSLLVSQDGRRYVIPRMNLEEVVNLVGPEVTDHVKLVNRQEVFEYHNSYLQLVRLSEVFNSSKPLTSTEREAIALRYQQEYRDLTAAGETPLLDVAVVRIGDRKIGLVVDHALDMEEIVVKPVHPAQKDLGIFLGATVLGDGKVALILDIDGIARHALDKVHYTSGKGSAEEEQFVSRSDDAQKMLVFECAEGERFAIGLSFIRRIHNLQQSELENIGGRLYARIGGKSLTLAMMNDVLPVAPCCMLEEMYLIMPRFGSRNTGILASRICGIHEIRAEFNEAATGNSALMGSAIIEGVTTMFPDIYQVCETAEHLACGENAPSASRLLGNNGVADSDAKHLPSSWGSSGSRAETRKRVLLAEDASFFRQLISTYLRREDIVVDTAANGAEALKMLDNNKYDLLLSDIEMPVIDGKELVRRVKSRNYNSDMPVIALTSLDNDEDRNECLGAGFDEYMIKINREQLLGALSKYL